MKKKLSNQDGWSFMETLIVIAVVMVLTASVGFMAINSLEKARVAEAKTQIDSFCVALEAYYIDCGVYPTEEQGLLALREKPETEPSSDLWNGPYLYKKPPKDPWGNDYVYTTNNDENGMYRISCLGADGKEGGEGKNIDLTSWD